MGTAEATRTAITRLGVMLAFLFVLAPVELQAQTSCNATVELDYLTTKAVEVGDVVRVRVTMGTGIIGGGTSLLVNNVRFALDCDSNSALGLDCADDGMVVAYEGDATITNTCEGAPAGVVFVSGHAAGDVPNEVVLTAIPPFEIPQLTPHFCNVEFDVRVVAVSNDATPAQIEQVAGFLPSARDAECDNGVVAESSENGTLSLQGGGQTSCTGFTFLDYPIIDGPPKPGDTVRASLTIGAGDVLGGGRLVVDRLRLDLDCDRDAVAGLPCPDDGAVMAYAGDATITTWCDGNSWVSEHEPGELPNQVVFRPLRPVEIPANNPTFCGLEFDLRVLRYSNDSTPGVVEQAVGFRAATGDAVCDNGLAADRRRQTALPLALANAFTHSAALAPLPRNVAEFGASVAAVGPDVLVGAPADNGGAGGAYLFDGTTGLVSVRRSWKNPDPTSLIRFGESVAAIGSDALVGALASEPGAGAVLRFRSTGELVQTFRLPDSNGAGSVGRAVAAFGPDVLAGAPGDAGVSGAVHLFDGTTGALVRSFAVADANAGFGVAIAPLGGNVLIGAPATTGGAGAAYILDGSTGALLHTLAADDGAAGFGVAVALVGKNAVVGSPGAVYVFDATSGLPVRSPLELPGAGSGFGTALAAAGADVLVGSPSASRVDPPFGAFLFDLASGLPRRVFRIPPGAAGFGRSVAVRGTDVVVGAPASNQGIGAAFVFDATANTLLRALERPRGGSFFGSTVGALGETLVVGASFDRGGVGAVYLLERSGEIDRIVENPAPDVGDQFGGAIAVHGTRLVVGARGDDQDGVDAGGAYLFDVEPSSTAIGAPIVLRKTSPAAGDAFGSSVAFVGETVLAGAPADDRTGEDAGAVHLFTGAGAPMGVLHAPSPAPGAFFGAAMAAAGESIVVGAPFDAQGAGAAYLLDPGTGASLAVFANPNGGQGDLFGASVAVLEGGRIAIAAPLDDEAGQDAGAVHLFASDGTWLRTYRGAAAGEQFGFSVSARGPDLLVGVPLREPRGEAVDTGAAYLFDADGRLLWSFANPTQNPREQFGFSVAAAGTDVLVGAARGGMAHLFTFCESDCETASRAARSAPPLGEQADEPPLLECTGGYCEDGDPCTVDLCTADGCTFTRLPDCRPARCATDLECETPNPCDRAGRCQECSGCFMHEWPCCSASSKCVGGPFPPAGTSCGAGSDCPETGTCKDGGCLCDPTEPLTCANCNDGDACTIDACDDPPVCTHEPASGVMALTCLFEGQPLQVASCDAEPVPGSVGRKFDKARELVGMAVEAHKPRAAKRLLRRAARQLGEAVSTVRKAQKAKRSSKRLGRDCAGTLTTILRDQLQHVKEYAGGLRGQK